MSDSAEFAEFRRRFEALATEVQDEGDILGWEVANMIRKTLGTVPCDHAVSVEKKYVGGGTYRYCSTCMATFGGEETPAKKALVDAAARAGVTEQDEVEGR